MYTGHFAVALGAGGLARRVPIALLIVAAFASDIVEGTIALFNVRDTARVWSHSLPAATAAGIVLALVWKLFGGTLRECATVCVVAMSHTLLDFVTATKTVWPGVEPMGLNLYATPHIDGIVEAVCCVAGWYIWRRSVSHRRWTSPPVLGTLLVLLLAQLAATTRLIYGGPIDLEALSKFVR